METCPNARVCVKFLGGLATDKSLTGSAILLQIQEAGKKIKILIDAGLVQTKQNFLENNQRLIHNLNPKNLDAIVLTHSHIDHIGRLPLLSKYGFQGKIFCTRGTNKLLKVMLEDSAKIQMWNLIRLQALARKNQIEKRRRAKNLNRENLALGAYDKRLHEKKRKESIFPTHVEPLYKLKDVQKVCSLVEKSGFDYQTWIKISTSVSLKFYPSGHVFGGAVCIFRIKNKFKNIYLGFSGDLGRRDGIILPPPEIPEESINYWFTESVYGGQIHPDREDEISKLLTTVRETVAERGKIIIPSFALERTQEILYLLSYYASKKEIPAIPIYLDSPLASKITNVFSANWETRLFLNQDKLAFNPFNPEKNKLLHIVAKNRDSENLIKTPGPYIVIAGAGMCTAGRIREHLKIGLRHSKNRVCLIGYMIENSLGRKLKDGQKIVKMNDKTIRIKAQIVNFESFSAHADTLFLGDYLRLILNVGHQRIKKIFLIHGEKDRVQLFKKQLQKDLPYISKKIIIPCNGDEEIIN